MLLPVVSIWDRRSKAYRYPRVYDQIGDAIRSFDVACRDPKTELGQFPEDFCCYLSGHFDTDTGRLTSLDLPQLLMDGMVINSSVPVVEEVENA